MIWNILSLLISHEESFLEFNTNPLETNIINILLLLGILVYANKTYFSSNLENRRKEIIQTIENAQTDVLNSSNYYYLVEKGFIQSRFWLQSWKNFYLQEKISFINSKYTILKKGLEDTFSTTENLILNSEKKAFISLQRYILLITGSKILRKFIFLSQNEQSKLIEIVIRKIGGLQK